MLFWRLELLVYAGEPITDYGVQVAAASASKSVLCPAALLPVQPVLVFLVALAACIHMYAGPGQETCSAIVLGSSLTL